MKEYDIEYIQAHPQEFFKSRKVCPFKKDDIYDDINNFDENSVRKWCEYFDIPFIEEVWYKRVHREYRVYRDKVFGKYLATMMLAGYKNFRYEDSDRLNNGCK